MNNQALLNHYYFPSELQEHLQRFISYYNHERYHEMQKALQIKKYVMNWLSVRVSSGIGEMS